MQCGGVFDGAHAGVAGPAAVVGVVAGPALRDAGAGRRRRREDIGRAGTRGAGAVLGHVALAGGGATLGGGGFEAVHAGVAGPAAVIGVVAALSLRDALPICRRRGEAVGRAGARGAGAVLGHVALAGGGATLGGGGCEGAHAGVADTAAAIGVVAGPTLRGAGAGRRRRREDVGRADARGAGAV